MFTGPLPLGFPWSLELQECKEETHPHPSSHSGHQSRWPREGTAKRSPGNTILPAEKRGAPGQGAGGCRRWSSPFTVRKGGEAC